MMLSSFTVVAVAAAGAAFFLRPILRLWGNKTCLSPKVCTQPLPPVPTVGLSLVLQRQLQEPMLAVPPLQVELANQGEEGVKGSELVHVSGHHCLVGGRGSEEENLVYEERVEGEEGSKPVIGWGDSEGGDKEDVIVEGDDAVEVFEIVELRDEDEEAYLLDGTEDYAVDDEEDYLVDDGEGYGVYGGGDDYLVDTADHYMFECGEDYMVDGGEVYIIGELEDYPVDCYQDYLADNGEGFAVVDGKSVEVSEEDYRDLVDGEDAQGSLVDGGVTEGCPVNGGDPEYQDGEIKEEVRYEAFNEDAKLNDFEVFVGGLNRDTSEADLFQVFNQLGTLTQVRLIMNPRTKKNKGYAFLRFATVDQAKRAILELGNPMVNGRRCTVRPSNEPVSKQPNRARRFPQNPSYGGTLERDCREHSCGVNVKSPHRENYSSSSDTSSVRRPYPDEVFSERPPLVNHKYYKQDNYRYSYRPYYVRGTNMGNRGYHGSRNSGTWRQYSNSPGLKHRGFANTVGDARSDSSLGNQLCRESNVGGSSHSSIHSGRDMSRGRGRSYWR